MNEVIDLRTRNDGATTALYRRDTRKSSFTPKNTHPSGMRLDPNELRQLKASHRNGPENVGPPLSSFDNHSEGYPLFSRLGVWCAIALIVMSVPGILGAPFYRDTRPVIVAAATLTVGFFLLAYVSWNVSSSRRRKPRVVASF